MFIGVVDNINGNLKVLETWIRYLINWLSIYRTYIYIYIYQIPKTKIICTYKCEYIYISNMNTEEGYMFRIFDMRNIGNQNLEANKSFEQKLDVLVSDIRNTVNRKLRIRKTPLTKTRICCFRYSIFGNWVLCFGNWKLEMWKFYFNIYIKFI